MRLTTNIPLERCLELICEYKLTNNQVIFHQLHFKFDLLIINTIHKLARQYEHLKGELAQELYHCAILGMEAAFLKIPSNEDPNMIPAWIIAYVKARIRSDFKSKLKEDLHDHDELDALVSERQLNGQLRSQIDEHTDVENSIDIETLFKRVGLSKECQDCIRLRYMEGLKEREIASKLNISFKKARLHLIRGMKLLRELIEPERDTLS